jgi:hypothetical protein
MATKASMTMEEARQFAVLIARAWADPSLADAYRRDSKAVLSGAGIDLGDRPAPDLPPKPDELASQTMNSLTLASSASSGSTITCPCTACTASCACLKADISETQLEAMMKLADDPKGREAARSLMSTWNVTLGTTAP